MLTAYFNEYQYMYDFIHKNNIKKYTYTFSFSTGYLLKYELPDN